MNNSKDSQVKFNKYIINYFKKNKISVYQGFYCISFILINILIALKIDKTEVDNIFDEIKEMYKDNL